MLAEIIPSERTFKVAGRDWKVSLLGFLAFHAELEIYIFQEMAEKLTTLAKYAPKEVADRWYERAYEQCMKGVPLYEAAMWVVSTNGFARAFWIAVKKHQPGVTYEQVRELLYPCPSEEINVAREAIEFAKGMMANPFSEDENQISPNGVTEKNANLSIGRPLSGGSLKNETGPLSKLPA